MRKPQILSARKSKKNAVFEKKKSGIFGVPPTFELLNSAISTRRVARLKLATAVLPAVVSANCHCKDVAVIVGATVLST